MLRKSPEQRDWLQKEILGSTPGRMVREICHAFEVMAAQNPLVLILEALHWVDASTLDLISALARRRGPAKLVVVGTYRPADVIISQSPLKALKQDLLVHHLCHEITVERLRWWTSKSCLSAFSGRSEEHTSELQSRQYLVCRLLLEKKKHKKQN